jgi:hypothetical protein
MEETPTPDVVIQNSKLTINKKTYNFYCKRNTKEQAELIRKDLISNGFDAIVRKGTSDYHAVFEVWWRKK